MGAIAPTAPTLIWPLKNSGKNLWKRVNVNCRQYGGKIRYIEKVALEQIDLIHDLMMHLKKHFDFMILIELKPKVKGTKIIKKDLLKSSSLTFRGMINFHKLIVP